MTEPVLARTWWGVWDAQAETLESALADTKARGYDGVEANPLVLDGVVPDGPEPLEAAGLRLVPRVATFGRTVEDHLDWLERSVAAACRYAPLWVIVQGGRDSWDDAAVDEFLVGAEKVSEAHGVTLAHESHRGRMFFDPWRTDRVAARHPDMMLAADYSHWAVVAERLLEPEAAILERLAPRVLHIDARVGHAQGPQVADPRLPEWQAALDAHERWWDDIWAAAKAAKRDVMTVVPEFGPEPYRPPGASPSDDINDWMADRIRTRWS